MRMPKLVDTNGQLLTDFIPSSGLTRIGSEQPIKEDAIRATLSDHPNDGVIVTGDTSIDVLASLLPELKLIAIEFPSFMDGRGFSLAQQISTSENFTGELRACGSFMLDQLDYLKRCGFNSFEIEDSVSLASVEKLLSPFSDHYQASATQSQPLFRRRA